MDIKLSTLAIVLGLLVAVVNLFGLIQPEKFKAAARQFPRSLPLGYLFMLAGTAWFMINVKNESLSDFESLKPILFMLFLVVGVGSCFFIQDYLAVRGSAVLMLLVAKLMLDTQRWASSEWRVVITLWAYGLILAGMWFTISPWRLRDLLHWATDTEPRIRLGSAVRMAFGVFVVVLGCTVFK